MSDRTGIIPFDPEIERTLHRRLRELRERVQVAEAMAEQVNANGQDGQVEQPNVANVANGANRAEGVVAARRLIDYATPTVNNRATGSIVYPEIQNDGFELKPALVRMIQQSQYGGRPSEDPHMHIDSFVELCDTVKIRNVPAEAIRLRLFPFSLTGVAKEWLNNQTAGTFTSWNQLTHAFVVKFFPPMKIARLRNEIQTFIQGADETLYEAWERFKTLQRRCPTHGIDDWMLLHVFYNGMTYGTRTNVDAAAGGSLMNKTLDEALTLINEMSSNHEQWHSERGQATKKSSGLYQVSEETAIHAKLDSLMKMCSQLKVAAVVEAPDSCEICGGGHTSQDCELTKEVNYVNYKQNDPYSQTYNPGYRNHPNMRWTGPNQQERPNQGQQYQQRGPPQGDKPAWKLAVEELAKATDERCKKIETAIDVLTTSHRKIEVQIGQIADAVTNRTKGNLPSQAEANPKQCNAMTILMPHEMVEKARQEKEEEEKKKCGNRVSSILSHSKKLFPSSCFESKQRSTNPSMLSSMLQVFHRRRRDIQRFKDNVARTPSSELREPDIFNYVPHAVERKKNAMPKEEENFVPIEDFREYKEEKKLVKEEEPKIVEKKEEMLMGREDAYSKEIVHSMITKEDDELLEARKDECIRVAKTCCFNKQQDPGSFTIPTSIGNKHLENCLIDLGSSISLISLNTCLKLDLQNELMPTNVSVRMADGNISHPVGIIEDVMIKLGGFLVPIDLVVIDMEDCPGIDMILGRPFLATSGLIVDVLRRCVSMTFGDEVVHFLVKNRENPVMPRAEIEEDYEQEWDELSELPSPRTPRSP